MSEENDVFQILLGEKIDERFDSVGQADGFLVARPVAGKRRGMHLMAGGANRGGSGFELGAGVPGAVNKHVSRHAEILPDAVRS